MNDVSFSEAIIVKFDTTGERKISTCFEAIECLNQQWPARARDHAWKAAVRCCRDALDGWRTAVDARRAVTRAARSARLLPQQTARQSRSGWTAPLTALG